MFKIHKKHRDLIREATPSVKESTFNEKIKLLEEVITNQLERHVHWSEQHEADNAIENIVEINQKAIRSILGKVRPTSNSTPTDFWSLVKRVCGPELLGEQLKKGYITDKGTYYLSKFKLHNASIKNITNSILSNYKSFLKNNKNKQRKINDERVFFVKVSPTHIEAKLESILKYYKQYKKLPHDISIQDLILLKNILQTCFLGDDGNYYMEQDKRTKSTGRIYMVGPRAIQGVKKTLRPSIVGDYYDVDIVNSAMCIKVQMAKQTGYEGSTAGIDYYINHTTDFRINVAKTIFDVEDPDKAQIKQVKQSLTAICFGAKATSYSTEWYSGEPEKNSLVKILTSDIAKKFLDIDIVKQMVEDLKAINRHIMKHVDLSKYYPCTYEKRNQKLAHSYQSCEKILLDIILEAAGNPKLEAKLIDETNSLLMPMHDGIMSTRKLDVNRIEEIVFEKTNFKIKLVQELISAE